jgi:cell division septation protein DedD
MASGGKRSGARDRVLEGRHVIGLFMLMLLFSAIFFTLGYVMGRNQYDGQVAASTTSKSVPDYAINRKPAYEPKRAVVSPRPAPVAAQPEASQQNSGWEFESTEKQKPVDTHPKTSVTPPSPEIKSSATVKNTSNHKPAPTTATSPVSSASKSATSGGGNYNLQVTAVRRESDALELAKRLQKKRFSAYVLSPQGNNKYYRVQVGPYADQKSAEAAKKGLENAGFRAIVKRG